MYVLFTADDNVFVRGFNLRWYIVEPVTIPDTTTVVTQPNTEKQGEWDLCYCDQPVISSL